MTIQDLAVDDMFIRWHNQESFTLNVVKKTYVISCDTFIDIDSYYFSFRGIRETNKSVGRKYFDESRWRYADRQTIGNTILPGVFR